MAPLPFKLFTQMIEMKFGERKKRRREQFSFISFFTHSSGREKWKKRITDWKVQHSIPKLQQWLSTQLFQFVHFINSELGVKGKSDKWESCKLLCCFSTSFLRIQWLFFPAIFHFSIFPQSSSLLDFIISIFVFYGLELLSPLSVLAGALLNDFLKLQSDEKCQLNLRCSLQSHFIRQTTAFSSACRRAIQFFTTQSLRISKSLCCCRLRARMFVFHSLAGNLPFHPHWSRDLCRAFSNSLEWGKYNICFLIPGHPLPVRVRASFPF